MLDRMSRLGPGLSAPQRNDWLWFKDTWDDAMLNEHKAEWGLLFSQWMQCVVNDFSSGTANNAFSKFVFDEHRRVLGRYLGLQVPGA